MEQHNIEHNTTQHNTQHNTTQLNTQHSTAQHSTAQHNTTSNTHWTTQHTTINLSQTVQRLIMPSDRSNYRRMVQCLPFSFLSTVYGAALLEHCLVEEGFPENVKIGKGFDPAHGMCTQLIASTLQHQVRLLTHTLPGCELWTSEVRKEGKRWHPSHSMTKFHNKACLNIGFNTWCPI